MLSEVRKIWNYDKPLEVNLVCRKCHIKLDKIKNGIN